MENKIYDLMEKMYIELQEVKTDLQEVKTDLQEVKTEVKQIQISIENEIKPKISLCLNELVTVKEKQQEHDKRFDIIESKLEQHDVEISVIKRIK